MAIHFVILHKNPGGGKSFLTLPGQVFPRKRGEDLPVRGDLLVKPEKGCSPLFQKLRSAFSEGACFYTESLRQISGCYASKETTQITQENEQNPEKSMENSLKPCWDEEYNGVFVPVINKVIDARNLSDKEENWDTAMSLARKAGKALPTLKEMHLMFYFIDEINALLEEHGGQKMEDWFWASKEYTSYDAWLVDFSYGFCDTYGKFNSHYVRAVAAI